MSSEVERWMQDAEAGMENALKTNPKNVTEQYEKQLCELKEAYGEAMLELKFRKMPINRGRPSYNAISTRPKSRKTPYRRDGE